MTYDHFNLEVLFLRERITNLMAMQTVIEKDIVSLEERIDTLRRWQKTWTNRTTFEGVTP